MDELNDGGGVDVLSAAVTAGSGRKQHGDRPQPLAAAVDDVTRQLIDQRHVRMELAADQRIDGMEVVRDGNADLFDIHKAGGLDENPRHATD